MNNLSALHYLHIYIIYIYIPFLIYVLNLLPTS